jgi:hypothetical protein
MGGHLRSHHVVNRQMTTMTLELLQNFNCKVHPEYDVDLSQSVSFRINPKTNHPKHSKGGFGIKKV